MTDDNTPRGAAESQPSAGRAFSRRHGMTKSMLSVLVIVNSLILVAIPYVLRKSIDVSSEAILMLQVAGFAVFGIALVFWFRRQASVEDQDTLA